MNKHNFQEQAMLYEKYLNVIDEKKTSFVRSLMRCGTTPKRLLENTMQ